MSESQLMDDHLSSVAEAFSRKAKVYDEFGEGHPHLARMRHKVYDHVFRFLRPGDRILELNAGTGTDAVYFAQRGHAVHAIDISPGMLTAISEKIERYGLQDQIAVQACSFTELEKVQAGPYQYVFSNFGGLNCIPDLAQVSRQLSRVLSPGGHVTWVILPPICPWELAQIFRGQFKLATRRLHPQGVLAHVEGVHFMTYYFSPQQVLRALGNDFHLRALEGLSILTPPADHKDFAYRFPRLYQLLARLDDRLSQVPPFNRWGDFTILTARYDPT